MAVFGLWTSRQDSVAAKLNPPPYTLQAPEDGKLLVQWTLLGVFYAFFSLSLFIYIYLFTNFICWGIEFW